MNKALTEQELFEETIEQKYYFQGRVFSASVKTVRLSDGSISTREIIDHVGGACVVALTEQNEVYLVRQFRIPIEQVIYELPAGKLEPSEDPLVCAQRELMEEVGITAKRWQKLQTILPSPGYLNEKLHIYLARDLQLGEAAPDEGEFVLTDKRPLPEWLTKIASGEICDAKTIIGLLLTNQLLQEEEK